MPTFIKILHRAIKAWPLFLMTLSNKSKLQTRSTSQRLQIPQCEAKFFKELMLRVKVFNLVNSSKPHRLFIPPHQVLLISPHGKFAMKISHKSQHTKENATSTFSMNRISIDLHLANIQLFADIERSSKIRSMN